MILNVNDYMESQGTPIDPKNILNEYKHNTSCIVVYDRNKKIVEFQFRSTSSKYNLTKFIKTISLEHSMGMGLHNRIEPQDSRLVYDVPIQESMEVVIKKMLKKFVNYMCKIDGIVEHSKEYITD